MHGRLLKGRPPLYDLDEQRPEQAKGEGGSGTFTAAGPNTRAGKGDRSLGDNGWASKALLDALMVAFFAKI